MRSRPGCPGRTSPYQHPNGASINWTRLRNSGQRWVYVKATEGTSYTNPYFNDDWRQSSAAGVYRGSYHFARPSTVSGSAQAQAHYFASTIGPQQVAGTLPPVLDLEQSGGLSTEQLVTWTRDFLTTLQSATGRLPILYTGPSFWRGAMGGSTAFTSYPLWVASYGSSTPPALGWPHWTFWQYTSSGTVEGIASSGGTDLSVFNGTALDLSALAVAGTWGPARSTIAESGNLSASRTPVNSRFVSVPAQRLLDTRTRQGGITGPVSGTTTVQLPGTVPADATGVVLDISAIDPRASGWIRVAASGQEPTTTALNYTTGKGMTGLVVTASENQGKVDVTTYGGATDLAVDLTGYYTGAAGLGGYWSSPSPVRVVDTRSGTGAPPGQASGAVTFTLPDSVRSSAAGVVLDVTAVDPGGDGYLRLSPYGSPPTTTAMNFHSDGSATAMAITTASDGQVTVTLAGSPTNLVIDLLGYYDGMSMSGSTYVAVNPQRFIDTRSGLGATGPGTGPLIVTVPGIVPRDALAVMLDVSVVGADTRGYVRLTAPGAPATTTAITTLPGQSRTGLVVTGLRDGQITLAVYGTTAQLVIDLLGYQTAAPTPASPSPSVSVTATPTASATVHR